MPDPFVDYQPEWGVEPLACAPEGRWPRARVAMPSPESVADARSTLEAFTLPAPFLKVHGVEVDARTAAVVCDRFVGVSAARAVKALQGIGRRLPLDVWLYLVVRLTSALSTLPAEHPWWRAWAGPYTFGVDLDARFVLFAGHGGTALPWNVWGRPRYGVVELHTDWAGETPHAVVTQARAVARVASWLLDPFPTRYEQPNARWEFAWSHPEETPALREVLGLARTSQWDESLHALGTRLSKACAVKPASAERVRDVLFGATPRALVDQVEALSRHPALLPAAWRDGGLAVRVDELLATTRPAEQNPLDPKAKTSTQSPADTPLLATSFLSLELRRGDAVVRRLRLQPGQALPERVALPVSERVDRDPRLSLRLVHPAQGTQYVALEAREGAGGFAELAPPTGEALRQATRLLGALDAKAARVLEVRRAPPAPRRAPLRDQAKGWTMLIGLSLGVGAIVGLPAGLLFAGGGLVLSFILGSAPLSSAAWGFALGFTLGGLVGSGVSLAIWANPGED